jgi:hypothetical protein
LSSLANLFAQTTATVTASGAQAVQGSTLPSPSAYAIVAADGNSRVWEQTTYEVSPSGQTVAKEHRYTELASGLNHLVNGQWVQSSEHIVILPNGTAAATNGQHQAYFPGDIYNGEIELVTPNGKQIYSQPLALTYFDGTNTVTIAELTNSAGVVVGDNQVVYPNAFTGISADLRYTYTKAGFEQDVIIHQQPPTPESYGLNADTARLQVMTEFFNPPQPSVKTRALMPQAGLALTDQSLNFGTMQMVPGRAFLLGQNAASPRVQVSKSWVQAQGRYILIEQVPVNAIVEGLAALPLAKTDTTNHQKLASHEFRLPPQRLHSNAPSKSIRLAKGDVPTKGFVLDYQTVGYGVTNYTFQGDTTYYISASAYLYGTTTIEGGTVVKLNNGSIFFDGSGSLICATSPYRPGIFTSFNNNAVGDTIPGSNGNPSAGSDGSEINIGIPTTTVHDVYFSYLGTGMNVDSFGTSLDYWNCQFNQVDQISPGALQHLGLHNVLITQWQGADTAIYAGNEVICENVTVDNSSSFIVASGARIALTNCIITRSTWLEDWGGNTIQTNSIAIISSPTTPVYQAVGCGSYYLTNGSPYRNAGTTNISPALLSALRQKTTYPPTVYSNTTFNSNISFSPQAARDTNSGVDLGYHYDPLDYAFGQCDLYTNLTFTAGTAVGFFHAPNYGISLDNGANLTCTGTASAPCWMVTAIMVQEGGSAWRFNGMCNVRFNGSGSGNGPQMNAQFAKWSTDTTTGDFRDNLASGQGNFSDCEFYTGAVAAYRMYSLTFTNCLFFRLGTYYYAYQQPVAQNFTYLNCSFYDGFISMNRYSGQPTTVWTIKNTAFDGTGFSTTDNLNGNTNYTAFDYNAYNTNNLSGLSYPYPYTPVPTSWLENIGPHDLKIGGYNWQSSWFGNFYLPTNSPLIDKGSPTADLLGLYHFTTLTNQVPETNSIVDIGYHYVATDTHGNPLDSNGNGTPDYLEDVNGNGQPFTITLIAPANNTYYKEPANIPLQATVLDWRSVVTNVSFLRSSTQIVAITNAPYQYTWPVVAAASYSLTATASDAAGSNVVSSAVSVTVTNLCTQ